MDETELRRLAQVARLLLRRLITDETEIARLDSALASALALPEGRAKSALRAALSCHPNLRAWAREHLSEEPAYRGLELARHLSVTIPKQVPLGIRFAVLVRVDQSDMARSASVLLKPFDVPSEGTTLTVSIMAPDLHAEGDLEQDLHVPPNGDSEPIRFGFTGNRAGLHTVSVFAFRGGTFLGELSIDIAVGNEASNEKSEPRTTKLADVNVEPGDVTLLVDSDPDGRYRVHLRSEWATGKELSTRLVNDPSTIVEQMITELSTMAAGTSDILSPADRRARLKSLGVRLWAEAVPEEVRCQFWEHRELITSFTVLSNLGSVPWELLYPLDQGFEEKGFLVEQFPVLRRVSDQGTTRQLNLHSSAFVVPQGAPEDARKEVNRVRETVGPSVTDQGLVEQLSLLTAMLEAPPSLLHFAGHNEFSNDTGSRIEMEGGPFSPTDIASAVQLRSLRTVSPIVFFNACRSAGEIPGLTQMMGWARQFMSAGAGVFIGTLWSIRSSAAHDFAVAFYEAFVTRKLALGRAVYEARCAIVAADGDPTFLAYTVYGNSAATISAQDTGRAETATD